MNSANYTNTFEPSDLAFLHRFFTDICTEKGIPGESNKGKDLAVQIIRLYQQGIRNEKDLNIQLGVF